MEYSLTEIGRMSRDFSEAGELQHTIMEEMSQYVQWMNRMNEAMSGTLSAMETELRAMTEETKEQQKYMNQFVEYTREISDSSTRYSNEMAEQLRILQEMDSKVSSEAKANMEEAFASLRETNREMRESTAAANAALARSAAEISDTLTRSAQSQVKRS